MSREPRCVFCDVVNMQSSQRIMAENEHSFAILDAYPISTGHSLIIPKRHVGSFFRTAEPERLALFQLIDTVKSVIDAEYKPDDYNIGINDGPNAGQTIPHLHIHLIPRYKIEGLDPRGGVRWLIPEKADYWSAK